MKNTIKRLSLLLAIFSITLISCKKEKDNDDNTEDNNNTATCLLMKATSGSGEITYTYNNDKKITLIHYSNGYEVEMTYNGDKLASVHSNFGNEITTNNYQYNASGQPISATSTMVAPDGTTTVYPLTFTHTGDKLTEIKAVISQGGGTLATIDTYTYNGDNVSSMETKQLINGSVTSTETTNCLIYDNKKNPYAELGAQIRYTMFQTTNGTNFISKNNCIKQELNGTIKTTSLEYNANNYPIKATEGGNVATLTYYPCQ